MMKSRNFIAAPPGATIREQLNDRGMSQKEFAARMGLSEKHISRLINGEVQLYPCSTFERKHILLHYNMPGEHNESCLDAIGCRSLLIVELHRKGKSYLSP